MSRQIPAGRHEASWPPLSMPDCPGAGWQRNLGSRPEGELKRIRVVLRHAREPVYDDRWNAMAPPGWSAETTRWSLTGSPFDVGRYLPL